MGVDYKAITIIGFKVELSDLVIEDLVDTVSENLCNCEINTTKNKYCANCGNSNWGRNLEKKLR